MLSPFTWTVIKSLHNCILWWNNYFNCWISNLAEGFSWSLIKLTLLTCWQPQAFFHPACDLLYPLIQLLYTSHWKQCFSVFLFAVHSSWRPSVSSAMAVQSFAVCQWVSLSLRIYGSLSAAGNLITALMHKGDEERAVLRSRNADLKFFFSAVMTGWAFQMSDVFKQF